MPKDTKCKRNAEELATDMSQLCDECPIAKEVLQHVENVIIQQALDMQSIEGPAGFLKYLEERKDKARKGMQNVRDWLRKCKATHVYIDGHNMKKLSAEFLMNKEGLKALAKLGGEKEPNETFSDLFVSESIIPKLIQEMRDQGLIDDNSQLLPGKKLAPLTAAWDALVKRSLLTGIDLPDFKIFCSYFRKGKKPVSDSTFYNDRPQKHYPTLFRHFVEKASEWYLRK